MALDMNTLRKRCLLSLHIQVSAPSMRHAIPHCIQHQPVRMQVADFMDAPTGPWAGSAYRLGLARTCTNEVHTAARALLATQTAHIRGLLATASYVFDVKTPLQAALQAPAHLHVPTITERLCPSNEHKRGPRSLHDLAAHRALDSLDGFVEASRAIVEAHRPHDNGPGIHIAAENGWGTLFNQLDAPTFLAALRALWHVENCTWLSVQSCYFGWCATSAKLL